MRIITTIGVMLWAASLIGCNAQEPEDKKTDIPTIDMTTPKISVSENIVSVGNKRIYGKLYAPENITEKHPIAIYSHGFGGTNSGGTEYAVKLAQNGIICYCIDFCGGSPASKSSGSTTEMSIFSEKEDLLDVVGAVKKLDIVDPSNIFLLGSSQGGMVSAMVGAEIPSEIKGMVLYYPAFCIPDDMTQLYPDLSKVGETFDFWGIKLGRAYLERLYGYNVNEEISKYQGNVLIIHGDRDNVVAVDYAVSAQKAYPSAELVIFEGAGHGFYGKDFNESLRLTLEFIKSNITTNK